MARFTKPVKYNDDNPIGIENPTLFADHSIYKVSFLNGWKYFRCGLEGFIWICVLS